MSADPKKPLPRAMEEAEPTADRSTTPIWLIALLSILAYAGMLYVNAHAGGFSAQVYRPYASYDQVNDAQPKGADDQVKEQGKKIFANACAVCHQATGLGTPGQFPPLAGSEWVAAQSPNRIIRAVLNGLQGPITVKDQPFNNVMVPWKDSLKDEDIAAVLTFVRGNEQWGNKAPPVTAEQVKAIREKIKDRSEPFTPDELLKLSDGD
jgi:mono/diheme cytochrome c family protein